MLRGSASAFSDPPSPAAVDLAAMGQQFAGAHLVVVEVAVGVGVG